MEGELYPGQIAHWERRTATRSLLHWRSTIFTVFLHSFVSSFIRVLCKWSVTRVKWRSEFNRYSVHWIRYGSLLNVHQRQVDFLGCSNLNFLKLSTLAAVGAYVGRCIFCSESESWDNSDRYRFLIFMIKLRIFIQIHIFANITKEMKSNRRLVFFVEYCNECYTFVCIMCIFVVLNLLF